MTVTFSTNTRALFSSGVDSPSPRTSDWTVSANSHRPTCKLTRHVEPHSASEVPIANDDLGPQPPSFVISLEAGCRPIRDHKTKNRTEATKPVEWARPF